MANGSKSAVPATPAKSTRGPTEYSSTVASDLTSRLSVITERSVSFEESVDEDSDAKDEMMDYDDLEEKSSAAMQETDDQEDAMLSAGHSGVPRSLSRNLVEEFDEVAEPDHAYDDYEDGTEGSKALVQVTKGPQVVQGNRPPTNGSTPAANKVLGRVFKQMMEESEWMQQLSPKSIRQAIWVELKGELAWPVNSINTTQVAEDTVSLIRAMGSGRELQKWKRKLRLSFGTTDIGLAGQTKASAEQEEDDPSKVPLPQTPQKKPESSTRRQTTDGVFSVRTEGTPYFQDSHMVTPRSMSRAERISHTEGSKSTRSTQRGKTDRRFTPQSASSDEDDYLDHVDGRDSPSDELARQVREVSEMERLSSTPRLELATHRPLAQIKHFSGARNKSENSMQWLPAFVYEMKGTHTPPNEWCMAFELSLRDGALHWYRQLPRKTKRQWKLLSDAFIKYYCSQFKQSAKARYYSAKRDGAEHICDYLNRLNGYARNAGLQFEKGGLDAKDHVHRFLESCGDRGLERRFCHVRVRDIHELEDMINDILKLEERGQSRETSAYPPRSRESTRRRDDRRTDSSRDGYRRDRYDRRDRDFDRRRDDSRHVPRISLAEASLADMMTELQVRGSRGGRTERSSPRRHSYSSSESEDGNGLYSEDDQSGGDYSDDYNSEDEGGHVAAANDHERRAAADGTYARSDHRQRKNGDFGRNVDRGNRNLGRDNREGRPVNMDRALHAEGSVTRPTTATVAASYVSKCMMSENVKLCKRSLLSFERRLRRRTSPPSSKA
ncbi:Eukaryotic/viral aspartic protease [Phytophthora cinnamomi]|uniref:Eukaryotic/viral aspartic protease n=1 Tax=Phytophthora cinnamomi TaxID=4785 RepID=UPI003559F6AB|nr:Eukaryotic/viral aspartic protease [Phytophthora cinnamomi]